MENFVAVDVETANKEPESICAIGAVKVINGIITERFYELVKPEPEYYSRYFTEQVHGIDRRMTENAPTFDVVWRRLHKIIGHLPLVAHNAVFDEGCLRAVHELYGMPYPHYGFHCTCRASRRIFGKTLPNHRLHTVSAACGYDLTNHHHALADAEACAAIAIRIL